MSRPDNMAPNRLMRSVPGVPRSPTYVEDSVVNRELHRLFVRESLADKAGGNVGQPIGVDERDVADLRCRQKRGELADELDPAFVMLALQAAVSAGVTFPGDVRKLTGLGPASPEFAERYGEELRRLVRRLA